MHLSHHKGRRAEALLLRSASEVTRRIEAVRVALRAGRGGAGGLLLDLHRRARRGGGPGPCELCAGELVLLLGLVVRLEPLVERSLLEPPADVQELGVEAGLRGRDERGGSERGGEGGRGMRRVIGA